MQDIIEQARRLGKAIADSPQAAKLRQARQAVQQEPETLKLMEQYQEQSRKLGELQQQQKPIEVDDKRRLQELHDQLVASDTFKQLNAAQVEYVDLMRKVDEALRGEVEESESDEEE